jgi:glycine/D-amino acid oxidase-like deaminating enzyme/nitrite reductase/ring-hydroxylating ferredoxin subunit
MKIASSYWQETKIPRYRPLKEFTAFDVVVVGGGITGLTAAYLLQKAGKSVCVVERDRVGMVDSGHTTAHITYVTDLRLPKIAQYFDKQRARLTWQAGKYAIDTIESIAANENIECEFRRIPGFLHARLRGKRDETAQLQEDADLARELGFEAMFVPEVPFCGKPGVRFANQAKFHPIKYMAGLAACITARGGSIFEQTEVTEVESKPTVVIANGQRIEADFLVIATHVPLMGKTGLVSATMLQTKLAPYSSYAIGAKVTKGQIPEASYWDTSDPYYYLRVDTHRSHDYLIFGGADHKTGQEDDTEKRYEELEQVLLDFAPAAKIDRHWSGQVIETNDGLPYIGETAERQFVATGFSGNGMTFGPFAAMMACEQFLGRTNPWQELFSVNRKKIRGGVWDFIKENVDFPYYFLRDRLLGAEGKETREVKRGDGKVLEINGDRVACHRDENGKLSTVSAVCTHMGCIVHWNSTEKTWDCPCHGSRFRPNGEVLAGPAEAPLEKVSMKKEESTGKENGKPKKKSRSKTKAK